MELTNDRDHLLGHAKTGEYCPEESSVNRIGKPIFEQQSESITHYVAGLVYDKKSNMGIGILLLFPI